MKFTTFLAMYEIFINYIVIITFIYIMSWIIIFTLILMTVFTIFTTITSWFKMMSCISIISSILIIICLSQSIIQMSIPYNTLTIFILISQIATCTFSIPIIPSFTLIAYLFTSTGLFTLIISKWTYSTTSIRIKCIAKRVKLNWWWMWNINIYICVDIFG